MGTCGSFPSVGPLFIEVLGMPNGESPITRRISSAVDAATKSLNVEFAALVVLIKE